MPDWPVIPGETKIDISHLKVKGVGSRSKLNNLEAENIRKAVLKYLGKRPSRRIAPFDLSFLKRLHKEMFGNVWKWAGCLRREDVNIGVRWQLVDESLQNLVNDLACWQATGMSLLECAVTLHHRAVQIHPFPNGNGRWARLLANVFLRLHDHPLTEWPETDIGDTNQVRGEYLEVLKAADDRDISLLLAFHHRFTPMPSRPTISQPMVNKASSWPNTFRTWTTQPLQDEE